MGVSGFPYSLINPRADTPPLPPPHRQHSEGKEAVTSSSTKASDHTLREKQDPNKENQCASGVVIDEQLAQLISEGHNASAAKRALNISHNDLTMARSILQEFVPRD